MSAGILPQTLYCPNCGLEWDTDLEPGDCCAIQPVSGYLCPDCGVGYDDEVDAIACCNWDCSREGYRLIYLAAVAAGQLELALIPSGFAQ